MGLYTVSAHGQPVTVMSADDIMEIEDALDTWLGSDLTCLQHDGRSLWDGKDRGQVSVREATADETAKWRSSYHDAVASGVTDSETTDWAVYLVSVSEEPDD